MSTGLGGGTGLSRGTVFIDTEACKGCDLCIAACPPRVLEMSPARNARGDHFPVLHPGCTGCAACQFVCPDFCFAVYRFEEPRAPEMLS